MPGITWLSQSCVASRVFPYKNVILFLAEKPQFLSDHNLQYFHGSFLFAIDTSAIFLAVQTQDSVFANAFVPRNTPVAIHECYVVLFRDRFADVFEEIMLLETAVKQSSGKRVKPS